MSRGTQVPAWLGSDFAYAAVTLCGSAFQRILLSWPSPLLPVLQPRVVRRHIPGLGSSAFARHYLRNHCYFLFLRVLRCFSSPRSPLLCR